MSEPIPSEPVENKPTQSFESSKDSADHKDPHANEKHVHLDDPSTDDTELEEIESLAMEEGSPNSTLHSISENEPGTILVPRIPPRGITVDRLLTKRKKGKSPEMIRIADDRTGSLRKLGKRHYLQLIMPLHVELLKAQNHIKENGKRVVVLFEGRDAAGKGGTIKRFIEHMNPRGCRVVALDKPTDKEQGQWYFQRYVRHLPTEGEIVLFDRSWYNRAMVERVMNFCSPDEVREFLRSVPEFERMLTRSGITLIKLYFSVSKEEQLRRFTKRTNDPLKQWKLSPVDLESQDKWKAYTRAKKDMFFYTSTGDCPWTIIKSDEKKRARINAMRHFLNKIDYPKAFPEMLDFDQRIVRDPEDEVDVED